MNSMTEILKGVKRNSRLFNEPPPPKPTADSLAAELAVLIEEFREASLQMRRWENRMILIQNKLNGLQTIQRP